MTRGVAGPTPVFDRMKQGSVFINTARGGLVDQVALANALRFGPLSGAGMDVITKEPVAADDLILVLPNVVLTPHAACATPEAVATVSTYAQRMWCGTSPEVKLWIALLNEWTRHETSPARLLIPPGENGMHYIEMVFPIS